MDEVLKATVAVALETKTVKPSSLERVTVDTTVQPKAIAHPTDSRLYLKALLLLVGQAKKADIKLRQSHTRWPRGPRPRCLATPTPSSSGVYAGSSSG